MATLYLMIGLPGSGKSTLAAKYAEKIPAHIVSTDAIRERLFGGYRREDNPALIEAVNDKIHRHLNAGENVIFDATNLRKATRQTIITEFGECADIVAVHMATPANICMGRNRSRARVVPNAVFRTMERTFEPPQMEEGYGAISTFGAPF